MRRMSERLRTNHVVARLLPPAAAPLSAMRAAAARPCERVRASGGTAEAAAAAAEPELRLVAPTLAKQVVPGP